MHTYDFGLPADQHAAQERGLALMLCDILRAEGAGNLEARDHWVVAVTESAAMVGYPFDITPVPDEPDRLRYEVELPSGIVFWHLPSRMPFESAANPEHVERIAAFRPLCES